MIASLQGIVLDKTIDSLIVMVGGVGLDVLCTRTALDDAFVGEITVLSTRLIVREDALTLFGFTSDNERSLFDTLIKISGVGPKLAIAVLSTLSISNLRQAVATDRDELLTRVPGIGKKTAQRMILDLKHKFPVTFDEAPEGVDVSLMETSTEVIDALVSLGFSVVEAQTAVQSLPPDAPKDIEERIRMSLQQLSR